MAWNIAPAPALRIAPPSRLDSVSSFASPFSSSSSSSHSHCNDYGFRDTSIVANPISLSVRPPKMALFAFKQPEPIPVYKGAPPNPAFADAETEKLRAYLLSRFTKRPDLYGENVQEHVDICTEIFSTFLRTDYGGPGTLMVEPFIDMADTIEERELPGGPEAARRAVKWAREHVDKDWDEWTSKK